MRAPRPSSLSVGRGWLPSLATERFIVAEKRLQILKGV